MTWRDELRPASFRGVGFFVETTDTTTGRRSVLHEYPGRDVPYTEDLGLKAAEVSVSGYVLGDDFLTQLNRLLAVLRDDPTPGELVHPLYGTLTATVQAVTTSFDTQEGGIGRFSATFLQAGQNTFPASTQAGPTVILAQAQQTRTSITSAAMAGFSTTGPGFLLADVQQAVGLIGQAISAPLAWGSGQIASVAGLASSVVQNGFNNVPTTRLAQLASFSFNLPGFGFGGQLTPQRAQQQANRDALTLMVRGLAFTVLAEATANETFTTYDDAAARRDLLRDAFDSVMAVADDPQVATDITRLQALTVADLTERAANLKRVRTVRLRASLPLLVVAQRLNGLARGPAPTDFYDLMDDISARSGVQNPNEVPDPVRYAA